LRHNPEEFGLKLNPDGSIKTAELICALQRQRFPKVDYEEIKQVVAADEKGRFSLLAGGEKIRANYGHSIEGIHPDYEPVTPPAQLYHGTSRRVVDSILQEGLKPMNRNFVHLSNTEEEARSVGKRRDRAPVILTVKAGKLSQKGHEFYLTGKGIYLTTFIDPGYIEKI
jgi:putative RNA 2'-phosphotransferase